MSIGIREALRTHLGQRYSEVGVEDFLSSFPSEYFSHFDAASIARHVEMIHSLNDGSAVRLTAIEEPSHAQEGLVWTVEVVGYDAFQFLSTVCTLLAVHGLTIQQADIFTSEPRIGEAGDRKAGRSGFRGHVRRGIGADNSVFLRGPRARASKSRLRCLVDVFRVELLEGYPTPDWPGIERELLDLVHLLRRNDHEAAQHRLIHRFVAAMERSGPSPQATTLEPLDLNIDPNRDPESTEVHVQARDSFGFLSLTTGALALCGIRIDRARIRTGNGRVDDTLWVTDRAGRKLDDPVKLRSLRTTLILIEHFSSRLPLASDPEVALIHFSRFASGTMARPDWPEEFAALDRAEVLDTLVQVLGESRFMWEDYLQAQPEVFLPMVNDPSEWQRQPTKDDLRQTLAQTVALQHGYESQAEALRQFRDREIFRTDVRTIVGLTGGLEGFSAELSNLAEILTPAAYMLAMESMGPEMPLTMEGTPVPSALCALGKFGGRELGFASDLELMLIYDDRNPGDLGEWRGLADYFDRLVAVLREILGGRKGSTFELDFRLRPYGKSGSPSTALSSFTSYFGPSGPAWLYERQALIKLRTVAGDSLLGTEIEQIRDEMIYQGRWPDPDERRRLRDMQVRQLVKPGTINAKYSPGALVDVEYTVQTLQLRYGADDATVRSPSTLQALSALEAGHYLSEKNAEILREGYRFFRCLVSALRVVHGHAKDLAVPPVDSEEFTLLIRRLRRSMSSCHQEQLANLPGLIGNQLQAVKQVALGLDQTMRLTV